VVEMVVMDLIRVLLIVLLMVLLRVKVPKLTLMHLKTMLTILLLSFPLLSLLNIWLIHANPPFFKFNPFYSTMRKDGTYPYKLGES
jgi:hypothetical protein